jgi:hypothetical protein
MRRTRMANKRRRVSSLTETERMAHKFEVDTLKEKIERLEKELQEVKNKAGVLEEKQDVRSCYGDFSGPIGLMSGPKDIIGEMKTIDVKNVGHNTHPNAAINNNRAEEIKLSIIRLVKSKRRLKSSKLRTPFMPLNLNRRQKKGKKKVDEIGVEDVDVGLKFTNHKDGKVKHMPFFYSLFSLCQCK